MKKSRPLKRFFLASVILLVLAAVLIGIDFYLKVFTPYAGYSGESVTISIKKGSSISAIARQLAQDKIIANYHYFRIYYRLFFNNESFKTGEYNFDQPLTMKEVIEKMHRGMVVLHKITIQEGLITSEIARLLAGLRGFSIDAGEFIHEAASPRLIGALDPEAPDLEGYLFPDTYTVQRDITAREMVESMVKRFKETFTPSLQWRAKELRLSIREVITLASLIEKETSGREERFLISSVFHNRLRLGMAMDCDPTIIYVLKKENRYEGKLGWTDLKYDSPYNTRLHRGLPPGPICSPGFDSLEAALYPENTKYLYFVAKDSNSHYFSESLEEHNRAVHRYIIHRN